MQRRLPAPVAGYDVGISVIGLAGNPVVDLIAKTTEAVAVLKHKIAHSKPVAVASWQRLIFQGRELQEGELVEQLLKQAQEAGDTEAAANEPSLLLQLVVSINPLDLLSSDSDIAEEAANGFEEMGVALMQPHITRLFEERDPDKTSKDILDRLGQTLNAPRLNVDRLRWVVLPYALELLRSEDPVLSHWMRLHICFSGLGDVGVPHVVAWLGLLPRPVPNHMRWRVGRLLRLSHSPRVRLAAKAALADDGRPSKARVEELTKLRSSLRRDIFHGPPVSNAGVDQSLLEVSRQLALDALQLIEEDEEALPRIRYEARRARLQ